MQEANTDAAAAPTGHGTLTPRTISRKLLARKAAARPDEGSEAGGALEDAFPAADSEDAAIADDGRVADIAIRGDGNADNTAASVAPDPAVATNATPAPDGAKITSSEQPESGHPATELGSAANLPTQAPAWSSEDERALQAMLARRKAAGYQRRGKDVSAQLIRAGDIAPNPDTVVATIVGLVRQAGGQLARGALLDAMAGAAYAHPKAQPGNRGWCQGYVAGALRDGYIAEAGEGACDAADVVPCAGAAVLA